MKAIGDLVKEENIDCDFCVTQVTDVCLYESGATAQKENLERLTAAGVIGIDDVVYSENETAEKVCSCSVSLWTRCTHRYTDSGYQRCQRLLEPRSRTSLSIQTGVTPTSKVGRERCQSTDEYSSAVRIKPSRFTRQMDCDNGQRIYRGIKSRIRYERLYKLSYSGAERQDCAGARYLLSHCHS